MARKTIANEDGSAHRARLRKLCAIYRAERYRSNVVRMGARRAKAAYDALEKLIATPIKKRKSRSTKPEKRFESKALAGTSGLRNLARSRADQDLVLEAEAIDALADEG